MGDWAKIKLEQLCELNIGKTPARDNPNYWDKEKKEKYIWLSIADMARTNSRFVTDSKEYISAKGAALFKPVKSGTLLMSFKLTIGRLVYAAEPMYTNEAIVALPIKNEKILLKEFLYYYLSSLDWNALTENDMKIKGKTLNKKKLKQLDIPLPPLPVQKAIVAKLDAAFASIDTAIAAAERNAENVKQLFQSYLSDVFEHRDNRRSNTGVAVMTGWTRTKIEELFNVGSSKRVLKTDWKTSGIPFYRGREITSLCRYGAVDNELYITPEHYDDLKKKYGVPVAGDIMITAIGTIGNTHIVRSADKFYFKDASVLWLSKRAEVDSTFINYWLKSEYFSSQLDANNGATVDTLTIKKLQSVEIDLPPPPVQKAIVAKLDELITHTIKLSELHKTKSSSFNALKQSLLQQAFNGQLVDA